MFYNGLDDRGDGTGKGDIFIDCAYTKYFLDMKKTVTARYLQNIGAFIGSAKRRYKIGDRLSLYRPEAVYFNLKKEKRFWYKYPFKNFDVVYLIDATGSMTGSIENVKTYCVKIANIIKKQIHYIILKSKLTFMLFEKKNEKNNYYDITFKSLKNFIKIMRVYGGKDRPEEFVGGYKLALNNFY